MEKSEIIQRCIYVKALPLRELTELALIKDEVKSGNIVILRITPLAEKSVEDVKNAINELCTYVAVVGGDIARLGEERIVITPSSVKIWRREENAVKPSVEDTVKPSIENVVKPSIPVSGMEFYCVKCRGKVNVDKYDIVVYETKHGARNMAQAKCPKCGTKLNRVIGKA